MQRKTYGDSSVHKTFFQSSTVQGKSSRANFRRFFRLRLLMNGLRVLTCLDMLASRNRLCTVRGLTCIFAKSCISDARSLGRGQFSSAGRSNLALRLADEIAVFTSGGLALTARPWRPLFRLAFFQRRTSFFVHEQDKPNSRETRLALQPAAVTP